MELKFVFFLFFLHCFFLRNVSGRQITLRRLPKMYPTDPTRATVFVPDVISKTCLLKPEEGPCRGKIPMYYFDPATKNCSIFSWGGCQGNGNRFDSNSECRHNCLSIARDRFKKSRPKYCSLKFDYGWCFGAETRYYYDPLWKVCKKTIYSGCGGNKNNFYNLYKCQELCLYGNTPMGASKKKNGIRKVIIINHPKATTREIILKTTYAERHTSYNRTAKTHFVTNATTKITHTPNIWNITGIDKT